MNTNEFSFYKKDSLSDSFLPIPKAALWGSVDWKLLSNDPVLFKMNCSKMGVGIGEEFEITIRVEWSYVTPAMMFTFDGSNSYTLKLLKPSGFVQTGGNFDEYIKGSVDENQPSKTYTIKGYFENIEEGTIPVFSLLRGHAKADNSSVFAKKASIEVPTQLNKLYFARKAEENPLDEQLTTINQRLQNLVMAVNSPTLGNGTFAITTSCPKRGEPVGFKVALGNTGLTAIDLYVYTCYGNCTKISEHKFRIPAQTTSKDFTFSEILEPSISRTSVHTHVHKTPIPTGTTEVCGSNIGSHNPIPITNIFKSLDFSGKEATTTAGVPVTLEVSGCINDQNVRWQDGTVGNSLIVTPATAGTYTYTATCTDGSCTYTAISTLSVEGTACTPPSSPPVVVSNKTGIVFGEIATLSASNCSGTVQWFGTGITGDVTGASYSTSVAGTFYAKCTNACGTSGNSLTKTISLVPLSISSDKNQAFYTEQIHLTAYGCNGYVQWQDPQGNFRSIVNNESNTFIGPGTYKARCVDNFGNIGAWVSISIATVTAPTPTIVANKYSAYPSESIVLTATGCSPYTYNWSFEGGSFFGPTQTVTGPGNYSVRCFHDDNTPSSAFVTITINETRLGTPSITASQLSAAANESVQLTSIGCTGESVINRWAINQNGIISYAWGNNLTITGAATVVANCISGNTVSASAEVVIKAKPPGATVLTASKSSACEGEPVAFVAQGCENGSVVWRKDVTVYLNDLTPTFTEGAYPISNKSFGGNPLKIGAETFEKGLGVKALSRIRYDLQGRYSKFKASIGRDIETATLCGTDVSIRFKVNVYSGTTVTTLLNVVMTASSPAQNIDLTVTGKSTLELIVEPEGSNCGDHADWGNARLEPTSGTEEIQNGRMVDFFGPGTYESYCVTAGISSPVSTFTVQPCINSAAPKIQTTKTKVFDQETYTLSVTGNNYYFAQVTQNGTSRNYWFHELPATLTGPAKIKVFWQGNTNIETEVFRQPNDGLRVAATKYKVQPTESLYLVAFGCDYGRVEWKIGTAAPSYGYIKSVQGPGYYKARCVDNPTGPKELYTNHDWVMIIVSPSSNIEPTVTAPLSLCPNTNATLSATGCPSGYGYQWKTLENGWNNWNSSTVIRNPQEFEVRCIKNDASFWYPSKRIEVLPALPTDFEATNNGPVLMGSNLRLAATFVNGATYQWTGPGGYTSGSPTAGNRIKDIPNATEAKAGVYTVTVRSGTCTLTATTEAKINGCDFKIKAIDAQTGTESYTLYPNPASTGQFMPLALVVEAPDGSPLNNYDFAWETTSGSPIAEPNARSIRATKGGVYKVRISPYDNPTVGCRTSVQIGYEREYNVNWHKARNGMMSQNISAKIIPVVDKKRNEFDVAFIQKVNSKYNLLDSELNKDFALTKLLVYNYNGTSNFDLMTIFPEVDYTKTHSSINGNDFTGKVLFYDFFTNTYKGGLSFSNGTKTGSVGIKPPTTNGSLRNTRGIAGCDDDYFVRVRRWNNGLGECLDCSDGVLETIKLDRYENGSTFWNPDRENTTQQAEAPKANTLIVINGTTYYILSVTDISACNDYFAYYGDQTSVYNTGVEPISTSIITQSTAPSPTLFSTQMCSQLGTILSNEAMDAVFPDQFGGCQNNARYKVFIRIAEDALKTGINNLDMLDGVNNGYRNAIISQSNLNSIPPPEQYLTENGTPFWKTENAACSITSNYGNLTMNPTEREKWEDMMPEIANDVFQTFKALSPLINNCDCNTSNCNNEVTLVTTLLSALQTANLPVDAINLFDNQAYAEESTLATLWSALGGSNLPIVVNGTTITYTPPTPETSASLSFKNGETKVEVKSEEQVRKGFAQELSRGIDSAISLNEDTWETTVFDDPLWELIFEAITETVPDFIPVYGEYLELKRAVEAFDNGSYGQSSFHFSMAILGVIGIDKIKDIAKITKSMQRAYKMWKLIKKIEILSPALARGMLGMVKNKNKIGHIFRVADGHMPALQPLVDWVGGQENLLYLVNKTIHDNGLINNLPLNLEQVRRIVINGTEVETKFIKYVKDGVEYIQVSNFYIPSGLVHKKS